MMRAGALALAALVAAGSGCRGTRRVGDAPAPAAPQPEAPDRPSEEGVPPAVGRPRVPASPEALLAEGAVGKLQDALAERGYLGRHRHGELDDPTSKAIRTFQADEGLADTGFPDRETLARLGLDPDQSYGRAGDAPR